MPEIKENIKVKQKYGNTSVKRKYFVLMVVCLGKKTTRVMKSGDICAVPVSRRQGGEVGRRGKKHKGLRFILILHTALNIPSELF